MALVLDATVGGVVSNSYATLAEANLYYEKRLYASVWYEMPDLEKMQGLIWGTQLIDERVDWYGLPASTTQALRCPRSGVMDRDGQVIDAAVLPPEVKRATMELARWLKLSDRTAESATSEYSAVTIGPISVTMNPGGALPVLPAVVADMLAPYGIVRRFSQPSFAQLLRVS